MSAAAPALTRGPGTRLPADAPTRQTGIMVCDRRGRVAAANGRLKELVSPGGLRGSGTARCCDVLGCAKATGALGGGCLTERSLALGEPLVDVRVEPVRGVIPLLVTAIPLCDAGSQVLFEVRPVPAAERSAPSLRIFALGTLRVEGPGGTLEGEWLGQRPGELLRFLVCERRRIVPADVIGEAIWPQAGIAAPNTVRHYVHALRRRLEPGLSPRACVSTTVICRRGGYGLSPHSVWIDADEMEREAGAGAAALASGDREGAREHLDHAMALYRGDFLADEPYAEWALMERERLRAIACEALRRLAEITPSSESTGYLERLAELEPLDDDVHRELISAWLLLGRRSRAVRHYESFTTRLLRAFGARPGFELSELAQTLEQRRCASSNGFTRNPSFLTRG